MRFFSLYIHCILLSASSRLLGFLFQRSSQKSSEGKRTTRLFFVFILTASLFAVGMSCFNNACRRFQQPDLTLFATRKKEEIGHALQRTLKEYCIQAVESPTRRAATCDVVRKKSVAAEASRRLRRCSSCRRSRSRDRIPQSAQRVCCSSRRWNGGSLRSKRALARRRWACAMSFARKMLGS